MTENSEVPTTSLTLSQLGATPQAAVRTLLTAFRGRGWRDHGGAIAIVRVLESAQRPSSPQRLARAVDASFLRDNDVNRSDVADVLAELANKRG